MKAIPADIRFHFSLVIEIVSGKKKRQSQILTLPSRIDVQFIYFLLLVMRYNKFNI